MWTRSFWTAAAERAVKTFAQTLAALLAAGAFDVVSAPWLQSVKVAGLAAVLSVLTSVASSSAGNNEGPSLVNEKVVEKVPA